MSFHKRFWKYHLRFHNEPIRLRSSSLFTPLSLKLRHFLSSWFIFKSPSSRTFSTWALRPVETASTRSPRLAPTWTTGSRSTWTTCRRRQSRPTRIRGRTSSCQPDYPKRSPRHHRLRVSSTTPTSTTCRTRTKIRVRFSGTFKNSFTRTVQASFLVFKDRWIFLYRRE